MGDKELKNPCPLSEGEWVQYLQTYITTNVTNRLTIPLIIISSSAIIVSLSNLFYKLNEPQLVIISLVLLIIVIILLAILYVGYVKQSNLPPNFDEDIQNLIEKIIWGNIKSDKIRDEWEDIKKRYDELKK